VVEQIFSGSVTSSEINEVDDSISKTDFKIRTVDACSNRDPRIVKVGLSNTGSEKLSSFDDFDVFATYDADIAGVKTRVTEQFTYDGNAFRISVGQPILLEEIPHDYVEVVSRKQTNNLDYNDLPGALLSSDNFERGENYLIYVTAQVNGNDGSEVYAIQTVHGATVFPGSEYRIESNGGAIYHTYAWFTVWSPSTLGDSVDDIKLQYKLHTTDGGDIGRFDQVTMFTMELSDDLTDNVDWFFDDELDGDDLPNTWTVDNNAEITFTPDCSNNNWLVLATAQLDPESTGLNYETRLEATGGVTTNIDHLSNEGEDSDHEDLYVDTIAYTYTIPSVVTTFTSQSQNDGGGDSGTREYSAVFALNLDKLKYHNSFSTPTLKDIGTIPNWVTEVQTLDFTPEEAGEVWILGYFISDTLPNSFEAYHARMQVYEMGETQEDQPPTQTQDLYLQNREWDNTEAHEWTIQTVESFDSTTYTADIDADAESGDPDINAVFRTLSFISMVSQECVGGDTGINLEVGEWTINCIKNDNLDPDIINKNEDAEILLKLEHQIFTDGLLEVSIATKNGETQVRSVVIP